ncbi:hypothetical protein FRB95_002472 [Tulasnella sp. JGI-2019a]|nr:hypothetical protein FRB93_004400 [Tulasnella sp. JGI-2019a]KAG9031661.1 hypothetical protein FRB95_002472 [Tulasnella sp. JGI-2019a]
MAYDLLQNETLDCKVPHLYRHDLESFYWLLMWITSMFSTIGKTLPQPPLAKWLTGAEGSRDSKADIFTSVTYHPPFTTYHLRNWKEIGSDWTKWLFYQRMKNYGRTLGLSEGISVEEETLVRECTKSSAKRLLILCVSTFPTKVE